VGKDELVVSVEQGRPRVFENSISEIKRLENWVLKQAGEQQVHIGMEATGVYSRGVAATLSHCKQFKVSVINPAQIKAFGRAMLKRTKTDQVDAGVIREFVRSQSPSAWIPPQPVREQLAALVAQTDAIAGDSAMEEPSARPAAPWQYPQNVDPINRHHYPFVGA
jgi:transposase